MTVRLEIGHERYVVKDGQVHPEDDTDVVHEARARYLSATGPVWVDQARHDGRIDSYTPDQDCTLARVIAQHIHGRFTCDPAGPLAEPLPTTQF